MTTLVLELPENEKNRIANALINMPSPYTEIDKAMLYVYPIFAQLPSPLLAKILEFGRYPTSPGFIQIDNLPVDPVLPPTPNDGLRVKVKDTYVCEGCLLGFSQILGEPIGYLTEKKGEIIHNVTPVKEGEYTQSNQGSSVFLNYHNDTVFDQSGYFNESNPDFLILNCLRADSGQQAETYYVEARKIVEHLTRSEIEVLRQPRFLFGSPSTFTREKAKGEIMWSKPMAILIGPLAHPEICVTANGVKPIDPVAEQVFQRLIEGCEAVRQAVKLKAGRALLINNRKGLHARSHFKANYDQNDRWLQRTYIRHELWRIRSRLSDQPRVY